MRTRDFFVQGANTGSVPRDTGPDSSQLEPDGTARLRNRVLPGFSSSAGRVRSGGPQQARRQDTGSSSHWFGSCRRPSRFRKSKL